MEKLKSFFYIQKMAKLNGDKNISDMPIVGVVVKDGSTYDVPIIIGIFMLIILVAFIAMVVMFSYCKYGKRVGICEKCLG